MEDVDARLSTSFHLCRRGEEEVDELPVVPVSRRRTGKAKEKGGDVDWCVPKHVTQPFGGANSHHVNWICSLIYTYAKADWTLIGRSRSRTTIVLIAFTEQPLFH